MAEGVAVLGVGETRTGEVPGYSPLDLQAEAVVNAMNEAGIGRTNDLGIVTLEAAAAPVFIASAYLSEQLGLQPRFLRSIDLGGTTGCIAMLQDAVWAIESGQARYVAITFGSNARSRRPASTRGLIAEKVQPREELAEAVGAGPFLVGYALASARMIADGVTDEAALYEIARVHSEHAMRSEQHQRKGPISRDAYFSSKYISWPLRRYDCSLVSDGAGAIVLGPAAEAVHPPVYAHGFAMDATHASLPGIERIGVILEHFRTMIASTLERSGCSVDDIDALYTHDAFTSSVAIVLAALGKPRGAEMARWIADGALDLDGALPTNTHGGLLSQAHVGGILHLVEAVRQLRGAAGSRQVTGAKHALIVGNGGILATKASVVLTSEPR